MSGTTSSSSSTATGQFHVQNGQIIDPNGKTFVARGINVNDSQMSAASQILADFPGLNFIRLAVGSGANPANLPDPSSFAQFIQTMSAHGVVVEVEDHPWGSGSSPQPNPYTGQQLTQETNWYAATAAMYKNNPYVWFGTMNEPQVGDGMQAQVDATYKAIRGTGSSAMIMAQAGIGGGNPQTVGDGGGYGGYGSAYTAAGFANYTNFAWDQHFYGGWGTNNTTDVSALQTALYGSADAHTGIAGAQTIRDADGTIPVIIGETGIAATNITDGAQVIDAVFHDTQTSGAVAWAWYPDWTSGDANLVAADDLSDGNGNLSSYGQIIAGYIAQNAANTTPTLAADTASSGTTAPSSDTPASPSEATTSSQELTPTSGESLTDLAGNVWTLTNNGELDENGKAVPGGGGTQAFVITDNLYYGQDAHTGQWYTYSTTSQFWASATAPNLSAIISGAASAAPAGTAYAFHADQPSLTIADFSPANGDTLTIDQSLQSSAAWTWDGNGGLELTFSGQSGIVDFKNNANVPLSAIKFA